MTVHIYKLLERNNCPVIPSIWGGAAVRPSKCEPGLRAPCCLTPIAVPQANDNIFPSSVYWAEFQEEEVTFTFNSLSNSFVWQIISANAQDNRWSVHYALTILVALHQCLADGSCHCKVSLGVSLATQNSSLGSITGHHTQEHQGKGQGTIWS